MAVNPTIAVNDLLKVVIRCDGLRTQAGEMTLGYLVTSLTGAGAGLGDLATALFTRWALPLAPLLDTSAQLTNITITRVSPQPYSPSVISPQVPTIGTGTGGAMPQQTSGLITKLTNTGGRSGKGRVYVPFPYNAANGTDGRPVTAYQSQLNVLGLSLFSNVSVTAAGVTVGLNAMLLHRLPGPLVGYSGSQIVDFVARSHWATQRRRSDYGRPNPINS